MATLSMLVEGDGSVSEWLRSRTRNPMGSARRGSNPLAVEVFRRTKLKFRKLFKFEKNVPRFGVRRN